VYEVTVEDECSNTATSSVLVNVEDVVPSFSFEYIGEYGIQVTNQTDNAAQISWGFGDEIIVNQDQYFYEFPGLDSWQVTLYVEGPLGCVKSVTEFYNPLANIYIPSAFTPNGDGINDVFLMKGHDLKRFEISIFNRWGDVVFSSNDIELAWTGSTKNGEYFVPDGVYNYVVTAEGVRGNIIEKNGTITIFR
jgi:gliding motility-associated-like protein